MIRYTNLQVVTLIAPAVVSVLLIWTVAIFHKNRKKWGPHDIPVVSLMVLSVLRNICVLTYLLFVTLNEQVFDVDYCGIVVWLFNSVHTFQASILTTIAVIGLFSSKLHRKKQNLRQFLTTTHIVYHLFCLTTLCACVGVAAILAKNRESKSAIFQNVTVFNSFNPCSFLPFELDIKFNIFILVLHITLFTISFGSFVLICYHHFKSKTSTFDYLKKSNSDLSDLSLPNFENKSYYDTYTVQNKQNPAWTSDMSNISTTVSSTNSRRPCISKKQYETIENWNRTGLETIHPILIVCYLFYHLPLMVLCIYPKLIHPYSVSGAALWLGLLQDLLMPIGLGIVDSRFCKWVASAYKCTQTNSEEKLPHVGVDGKFRPFGGSQPQSLEVNGIQERSSRGFQTIEHRFPITTGTLYTSIDGNNRLPVIQNYRRQNREQLGIRPISAHEPLKTASNVSLHHSAHLKRPHEFDKGLKCSNCEANLCPSHSDLHHLSHKQINYVEPSVNRQIQRRLSVEDVSRNNVNVIKVSNGDLSRVNSRKLSKSQDNIRSNVVTTNNNVLRISQRNIHVHSRDYYHSSESDEDYSSDNQNNNFDSTSSCNSITTEANCDFEFYHKEDLLHGDKNQRQARKTQQDNLQSYCDMHNNDQDYFSISSHPIMSSFKPNEYKMMMQQQGKDSNLKQNTTNDNLLNFKIKRSNSKRSLENFQMFIETDVNRNENKNPLFENNDNLNLKRSNSYMTLEDCRNVVKSDKPCFHLKNKSIECIPIQRTLYYEDFRDCKKFSNNNKYIGSVPDFKKVFISEFI
ncbi:unnamed protein product [Brassicogethes aeneus]|uniref:G-protein coupled receptors family 1 profile domain-containing protein n=1 Tax=Brassicogethes aeneus TaxID=1431903 RepID=A0A9P0AV41_BRAAE|nr:unnamed protein product [Brassicogethes aeneus]